MMEDGRIRRVKFLDEKLYRAYLKLKEGKEEEKQLAENMDRAVLALQEDHEAGIHIPRNRWPKYYRSKFGITNLWKYDLPKAWRLVYTITGDQIEVISIILEWFDHKEYNKRFGYKVG